MMLYCYEDLWDDYKHISIYTKPKSRMNNTAAVFVRTVLLQLPTSGWQMLAEKNCCTFWRSADYWSCQAAVWLRTNKRHSKEKDSNKQHICIDHLSRPMAGELKRCLVPSCREVEQYAKKEDQNTQEARNNALFESDNAKHEQIFSGNTFLR